MITVKPDLLKNNTSDRTGNILQIIVGTGDGSFMVTVGVGSGWTMDKYC